VLPRDGLRAVHQRQADDELDLFGHDDGGGRDEHIAGTGPRVPHAQRDHRVLERQRHQRHQFQGPIAVRLHRSVVRP